MDSNNTTIIQGPAFFPDNSPAPFVLTEEEAIKFLRIDTNNSKHPDLTIQHYINKGLLFPIKIGKNRKYPLPELIRFIQRLSEQREDIS